MKNLKLFLMGVLILGQFFMKTTFAETISCPDQLTGFNFLGTYNQHNYFISTYEDTWQNAQAAAATEGAYLVSFNDQAENDFVTSLITEIAFIGYYDTNNDGTYIWDSGENIMFSNIENTVNEQFANMNFWDGQWAFDGEWTQRKFIVELPCATSSQEPDLSVTASCCLNLMSAPGQVEEFNFDLTNAGAETAFGDYALGVYLSTDQLLSSDDIEVGTVPTGNTPVGTIQNVTGAITVPGIPTGSYFLIINTDVTNNIQESNESNNVWVHHEAIQITDTNSELVCNASLGNFVSVDCVEFGDNNFSMLVQNEIGDFTNNTYDFQGNLLNTVPSGSSLVADPPFEVSDNDIVERDIEGNVVNNIPIDPALVTTYTTGANSFGPVLKRPDGSYWLVGVISNPPPNFEAGNGEDQIFLHHLNSSGMSQSELFLESIFYDHNEYTLLTHLSFPAFIPLADGSLELFFQTAHMLTTKTLNKITINSDFQTVSVQHLDTSHENGGGYSISQRCDENIYDLFWESYQYNHLIDQITTDYSVFPPKLIRHFKYTWAPGHSGLSAPESYTITFSLDNGNSLEFYGYTNSSISFFPGDSRIREIDNLNNIISEEYRIINGYPIALEEHENDLLLITEFEGAIEFFNLGCEPVGPDLSIGSNDCCYPELGWYDALFMNFDLHNLGGQSVNGTFDIAFYLSNDQILDDSDYGVGTMSFEDVDVGTLVDNFANLNTGILPYGTYWLIGHIDVDNVILETDEDNNIWISDETITIDDGDPCETFHLSHLGDYNGQGYYINNPSFTENWDEANAIVESMGLSLVTVDDEGERDFLKSVLSETVYIGGHYGYSNMLDLTGQSEMMDEIYPNMVFRNGKWGFETGDSQRRLILKSDCAIEARSLLTNKETTKILNSSLYPNPAFEKITVNLQASESFETNIAIYDVTGVRKIEKSVELFEGDNSFELNVSQLSSGIYTLWAAGMNGLTKKIFIKQ